MDVKSIILFTEMQDSEPATLCNVCGEIAHYPGRKSASIYPYTDSNEACSFVVCGPECEQVFNYYPNLENFVMRAIEEVQAYHGLQLKTEYLVFQVKVNEATLNN